MKSTGRRRWPRAAAIGLLGILVLGGCVKPATPRPELYAVRGRVIDAATMRGLGQARLVLRASLIVQAGPQRQRAVLTAFGITEADGTYVVELSAGYRVVSEADRIRLDVSKSGYSPVSLDIPPPTRQEKLQKMPDVMMARVPAVPWGTPTSSEPLPPPAPGVRPGGNPLPWKE